MKPTKPCFSCGSRTFWLRDSEWVCAKCHPPPTSEETLFFTLPSYSKEVLALRARVIKGNDLLYKAFIQANNAEEPGRTKLLAQWDEANRKLDGLCQTLMAMGYRDCLYIDENGNKTRSCLNSEITPYGCWICPSERKYWREEMDEL